MSDISIKPNRLDPSEGELFGIGTQQAIGKFPIVSFSSDSVTLLVDSHQIKILQGGPVGLSIDLPKKKGRVKGLVNFSDFESQHGHAKKMQVVCTWQKKGFEQIDVWNQYIDYRSKQLTAYDIMNPQMVTLSSDHSIKQAAELMAKKRSSSVLITAKDKTLLGIFTERDYVLASQQPDHSNLPVSDFMTSELAVVDSDTCVEDVHEKFRNASFRHLPVVNGKEPVGVISIRSMVTYWSKIVELQKDKITAENERMLGVIVHDLRNPIFAIKSMNDMLLDDTDSESMKNFLDCEFPKMIDDSCELMAQLINELLQISSFKAAPMSVQAVECDFTKIVDEAIKLFSQQAKIKSIDIEFTKQNAVESVFADPKRLTQVVQNLLSNAVKYSDIGSKVQIDLKGGENKVEFSVIDFGQGIEPSEISKVFDEHCKVSSQPTAGEPSTGLGLSIAKRIVNAHGGEITATSTPGQRTTFSVSLPKMLGLAKAS